MCVTDDPRRSRQSPRLMIAVAPPSEAARANTIGLRNRCERVDVLARDRMRKQPRADLLDPQVARHLDMRSTQASSNFPCTYSFLMYPQANATTAGRAARGGGRLRRGRGAELCVGRTAHSGYDENERLARAAELGECRIGRMTPQKRVAAERHAYCFLRAASLLPRRKEIPVRIAFCCTAAGVRPSSLAVRAAEIPAFANALRFLSSPVLQDTPLRAEHEWSTELGPKDFARLKELLSRVWENPLTR